jgi:hypothetical protein
MHGLKKHNFIILALVSLSFLCSGPAFGQGVTGSRHTVGGFLGFTSRHDTDFTFGGEYEYRLQTPWAVGAIVEHTSNVRFGRDYTLVLATAHYRPPSMSLLKLTGGAGVEFRESTGDKLRLRFGAGYDVFKEGSITVTPRVAVDFGQGSASVVFGVSALFNL